MPVPQTSVAAPALAIAGQLADADQGLRIESRVNDEAAAEIPFGTMVIRGSTAAGKDTGALQLHTSSAAMVLQLTGVVVHSHEYANDTQRGDTGLKPKVTLNVLRRGTIWVKPETAVAPGDPVKVRAVAAGAEVKGAFRATADTNKCVDISKFAQWRTSAAAGGFAKLEIDMVGAATATADV